MRQGRPSEIWAVAVLLASAANIPPAFSQQQVGTAAAVNPAAQARGTGGSRSIVIGQSIAHRERIQTASSGSVELLFLDKTAMTVGPNSDISIDEYVYDPSSNSGKLAATLTKGVMRFVGGQISHAGNAQISTPTAVVGIRGGVGIFNPNSVYIGYGEGVVKSGPGTVTLEAGDYVQTFGGGQPPTPPGPPPPGYLESVLAQLQSKPGQGGGARVTERQVNQARRRSSGSFEGNIATDIRWLLPYWPPVFAPPTFAEVNQSIHTVANTFRPADGTFAQERFTSTFGPGSSVPAPTVPTEPGSQPAQTLVGFTAGLVQSVGRNGELGSPFSAFGTMSLVLDPANNRSQANFTITSSARPSPNALQTANMQFGSIDPNLPSGNVSIDQFNQFVGTATALRPATTSGGEPTSTINGGQLIQHTGLFVEMVPGSQLSNSLSTAVGTKFCDCAFTRWGFWDSRSLRPGPNNSTIDERALMLWVGGRQPSVSEVPTFGEATYTGHAIANIRNGSQSYIAAGSFDNVVNFGTRTGRVSVSNFDFTNYSGTVRFSPSDPRLFGGSLASSTGARNMTLSGSFFNGVRGPVGEMGGALQVTGSSYLGAGIFAGTLR